MSERPVLITDARLSADEELSRRTRRYAVTMLIRIPLLIASAVLATSGHNILALITLVASIPLPWVAVMIANEGPARNSRSTKVLPGTISYDRAIENHHEVVESDPDGDAPKF